MNPSRTRRAFLQGSAILLLFACSSAPDDLPEDSTATAPPETSSTGEALGQQQPTGAELVRQKKDVLLQHALESARDRMDAGDYEGARDQYERALELSAEVTRALPGESAGPQSEAWILRKLGRLEEAEAKAREALDLEPENGSVYLVLSGVALDRGDLAAAREHLARAERLVPGTVGVALLAAEIALASSDPNAEAVVGAAADAG